jgi:hypothetical protein
LPLRKQPGLLRRHSFSLKTDLISLDPCITREEAEIQKKDGFFSGACEGSQQSAMRSLLDWIFSATRQPPKDGRSS